MTEQGIRHLIMTACILLISLILSSTVFAANPTATTNAATGITISGAVLNGTVNAGSEITVVTFRYGLTAGYGTTVVADQSPVTGSTDTAVSVTIGELSPNTTYHYQAVATNASETSEGADMTFTTLPDAPAALTTVATGIGPSNATLNGAVHPRGVNTVITFEYGTDTSYGTSVTADQSPQSGDAVVPCSHAISGLTNNTLYHYRIVATNAGGTTNGNDMTFAIGTVGGPPTATTGAATGISNIGANLNGTVNANDAITVVTFEYGLTTSYGSGTIADQSPVSGSSDTAVSRSIGELVPNTLYHYRVVAVNMNGTDYGDDLTFTTMPNPPSAVTNAASSIQSNGATINGTVNANGNSATVNFEYGETTSYGTTVSPAQSPVTGATDTSVNYGLSGLNNNTMYHYRVIAVNAGGTTYGADMTFTTGIIAPDATTNAASSVGIASATLNGTVNANNANTNVSFEFGTTTSYGRTLTATPGIVTGGVDTAVDHDITGLAPNTIYHYRVAAQNASGTTYGDDITFTTLAAPAVTTNTATGVNTTVATLNGTVNANGSSTTVTFEYGLTTAYGTTTTADQSPVTGSSDTLVSRAISGLTNNTIYHYRAVGTNANGTTYGADMIFETGTPAVPVVTTDPATFVLGNGATLNGTVDANNSSTTVTFEYGVAPATYTFTVIADQSPVIGNTGMAVSRVITGLTAGLTYYYRVVGTNAHGTTNGAEMAFTISSSPIAVTTSASDILPTSTTLNGIVNPNGAFVNTGFNYGSTTAYGSSLGADQGMVSGSTDTPVTATINGLIPNTIYHYQVYIYNLINHTYTYGSDMTFTTLSAPTAITNAASAIGTTSATLNGTVNASDVSTTVTFELGIDTSYGFIEIADQSPVTGSIDTAVSKTTIDLRPNTIYHYRVVAQNVNATVYGADQTFTTDMAPPMATTNAASGITSTGAVINGTVNANNENTTVTFEYGLDNSYGTTVTADQSPVSGSTGNGVSYTLSGLSNNTVYHYRVVAQNGTGTTFGADMTFNTGATTPTAITNAATGVYSNEATVNGTVNANGDDTNVTFELGTDTGYGRTESASPNLVTGNSNTAVSHTFTGLQNATTYHYRVVAQNALGTTYGADRTFITGSEEIPTLSEYGLMLLILLLGAAGVFIMKRREESCEPTGLA